MAWARGRWRSHATKVGSWLVDRSSRKWRLAYVQLHAAPFNSDPGTASKDPMTVMVEGAAGGNVGRLADDRSVLVLCPTCVLYTTSDAAPDRLKNRQNYLLLHSVHIHTAASSVGSSSIQFTYIQLLVL
jgi:hypothetical protein